MRILFAGALAVLLGNSGVIPVLAHEGHDHDQPKLAVANVQPRAEAVSDLFELVAIAGSGELLIWLDRFATNEPVEGATIEVETPAGSQRAIARKGDSYRLGAPWLGKPGVFNLIFTITAAGETDILPVTLDTSVRETTNAGAPPVVSHRGLAQSSTLFAAAGVVVAGILAFVFIRRRRASVALLLIALPWLPLSQSSAHEGEDHNAPAPVMLSGPDERAQRLPDGTVFVPKSVQRIFAVRTALTKVSAHRRSIELPGRIIPDPNASGYAQTSVGGRLSPPAGGFLRLGTHVKQGDVLAYVTPPLQAIDVSTMRQQQGDLDQQISIVERRLGRYETLAPSGSVARSQLEDTRLELQGLKERRASLDRIRREPEALVAPVSGVIADGSPVAGQMAQPGAVIFHIVDPKHLWVEALSFDTVAGSQGASAVTASGRRLALSHRGSGFADRSQSIPVHFAIDDDTKDLRAGQFVTVLVSTGDQQQGIAIPRAGVVRAANGQDFVFEHTGAEAFVARPVRVEPLDGQNVLIAAGLQPGKRIVAQGAELLDHVR